MRIQGIDVFDLAHKVSIVESMEQYISLQPRNGKYYGLCPFHNDHNIGSFVVYPDVSSAKRGRFQCYACGEKGDNIDFVKNHLGISYREAAVTIALNAGMITRDEADTLMGKSVKATQIQPKKVAPLEKKISLANKRDPEHLNRVYKCFANASNSLPRSTQDLLLNKRKIPTNSLPKYFQFPSRPDMKEFWIKFRRELSKEFCIFEQPQLDNLLIGVPGFYINNMGNLSFSAANEPRIGIKIFDRKGRISGIQTRAVETADGKVRSKEEKDKRYKLLSSGYANGTPGSLGTMGCSCGYVEDVLYPSARAKEKVIAITEGRFKAEILSTLGYTVVNMHGISNWKPAGEAALEVAKETGADRFILCYDCEQNDNVKSSASSLYEKISPVLPTGFAIWNPANGKGIDDVVISGHLKDVSRVTADVFFAKESVEANEAH